MTGRWLLVFPSAQAETPPAVYVPVDTPAGSEPFLTSGWEIRHDVLSPFEDRVQVDLDSVETNEAGIAIYRDPDSGDVLEHPIVTAQYAQAALQRYSETGDRLWLDRATTNANELIDTHTDRDGTWWFQYDWDWTYLDRTLTAPWWSGMAQGEALTVFSRLAAIEPENPKWSEAADKTFSSFLTRGSGNEIPWVTTNIDGRLWFEEYAGNQPPLQALNGHIFAIFGIYEYHALTGSPEAERYIDGGATAVLEAMPAIRSKGGISQYCAQIGYCHGPSWKNEAYHPIHIQQLEALGRITSDPRFHEWAEVLALDTSATG